MWELTSPVVRFLLCKESNFTVKMEVANPSETLKLPYRSTMNIHYRWCENFKSCRKYYAAVHVK